MNESVSSDDATPAVLDPAHLVSQILSGQTAGWSHEEWVVAIAWCQTVVNTVTAAQDIAVAEVVRREGVWQADGTLGEVEHAHGRVTLDAADLVAPSLGSSHAPACVVATTASSSCRGGPSAWHPTRPPPGSIRSAFHAPRCRSTPSRPSYSFLPPRLPHPAPQGDPVGAPQVHQRCAAAARPDDPPWRLPHGTGRDRHSTVLTDEVAAGPVPTCPTALRWEPAFVREVGTAYGKGAVMRAIWKGAVSFGLVNVPVRLYSATENHDVQFRQVHREDGGRIRYRRICQIDGEEVSYDDIAKGYETEDGDMVVLTDEDFADLPSKTSKEIGVTKFVPEDQIDPMWLDKSYFLEPDKAATKPYVLLRDALEKEKRVAIVTVSIRTRMTMAVLRVRDGVIVMQTMLWPDEVRSADFAHVEEEQHATKQEMDMAKMLIDQLAGDYEPDEYEDDYAIAVQELVRAKVEGGEVQVAAAEPEESGEVVDLLAALARSVEKAKASRGEAPEPAAATGGAAKKSAAKKGTAKKAATKKGSSTKDSDKKPAKKAS